jgi:hypothetical protein
MSALDLHHVFPAACCAEGGELCSACLKCPSEVNAVDVVVFYMYTIYCVALLDVVCLVDVVITEVAAPVE